MKADEKRTRQIVLERAEGACERCGRHPGTDQHHLVNRSAGGKWEPSNIVLLCRPCHSWVGLNPNDAHEVGLHYRSWEVPGSRAVLRWGVFVLLWDDGSFVEV